MVRVRSFCVDRWEVGTEDAATQAELSPYYPPEPRSLAQVHQVWQLERSRVGDAWARAMPLPELPAVQRSGSFSPRAVSRGGKVPQGYLSYFSAKLACQNAGKRLCTLGEWTTACKGERDRKFPYGDGFERSACNVYRWYHPAFVLHGNTSVGHRDPRLNLVVERDADPVLRLTGASPRCASRWGEDAAYDMVGNLDEWVDDEAGVFAGGFYARATTSGCEALVTSHSPRYYDYSTGARCCSSAR
jgi:formylglycine-generating enzyme required for sulfatase activity